MLKAGKTIVLRSLPADLPPEAVTERTYVERTGIRSHVGIPLRVGGQLFGAIGFAGFRHAGVWYPELVGRLKTVGEVLAASLARNRAEAELRTAARELHRVRTDLWHADRAASAGALAGSLAHELNQPLAAILSNAQAALRFLERGDANDREIRAILEAIVHEDKRAGTVIRGLRAMLRREEVPRTNVDLADAFADVLALMRAELDRHGVEVETQFQGDCVVSADKTQIQQIALNLIRNAIEAMQPQRGGARRLRIAISRRGTQHICVAVSDTGVGIPADKLGSIFQPFRTMKKQGMGLGLSIARAIVEAHGGEIQVQSNRDCGVTFEFSLPATLLPLPRGPGAAPTSPPRRCLATEAGTRTTVCLVDDDPAVRAGLERLLVATGFAVESFASARDFLQQSALLDPACMLLDVRMANMSGPELYARFDELDVRAPVVFLTADADVLTGVQAMKQGAFDYLLKPVDEDLLLDTVRRAVRRHLAQDARRRELRALQLRFDQLSAREREVMQCVVQGHLNKQIAAQLGISEKTVKQHRGRVMEKVQVRSVAELVRLCESVGTGPALRAATQGLPGGVEDRLPGSRPLRPRSDSRS
jgi:FixJ family two-component response regulator/signal transduction histidine kinase